MPTRRRKRERAGVATANRDVALVADRAPEPESPARNHHNRLIEMLSRRGSQRAAVASDAILIGDSRCGTDDIFKDIVDAAASGAEVSLPGFGKFKVKATPEREGRNPANGEKIKIAASKKLTFSSAKSVKDLLNGRAELPGN